MKVVCLILTGLDQLLSFNSNDLPGLYYNVVKQWPNLAIPYHKVVQLATNSCTSAPTLHPLGRICTSCQYYKNELRSLLFWMTATAWQAHRWQPVWMEHINRQRLREVRWVNLRRSLAPFPYFYLIHYCTCITTSSSDVASLVVIFLLPPFFGW